MRPEAARFVSDDEHVPIFRPSCLITGVAITALAGALALPPAAAFHFPWDQGHDTFQPEPPDDDTEPEDDDCNKSGSPFEVATGNFVHSTGDLFISALGLDLAITRTYNSRDMRSGLLGHGWTLNFEQRVIEATDGISLTNICLQGNGKRERFDATGGCCSSPSDLFASLVKNPDDTFTLVERHGTTRHFNVAGRLAEVVDRNGNKLTLSYDSTGFLTSVADAVGRELLFTKGANGKVELITDFTGRELTYAYDTEGNPISFTGPQGNTAEYRYQNNNLIEIIDPLGDSRLTVTYDSEGRVRTYTDPLRSETWTVSYFPDQNRTIKQDGQGQNWILEYNDNGNVTRTINPLGGETQFTYDEVFNITSTTDENGNTTTFTYDSDGNRLTQTDPLLNTTSFTYDGRLLTSINDPHGIVTTLEYDSNGNRTKMTEAVGTSIERSTTFGYDSSGNLVSQTDPLGNTTTFTCDAHGNRLTATDPLGNTTSWTYDSAGNATSVTGPDGHTTQFEYDLAGNLLRVVDDEGTVVENTYGSAGRVVSRTDGRGNTETFVYDKFGQIVSSVDRGEASRSWEYGPHGETEYTDGRGSITLTEYDAAGRVSRVIVKLKDTSSTPDSDDEVTTFTRDAVGNAIAVADASGNTISHAYDALNRLTRTTIEDGDFLERSYDEVGRLARLQLGNGKVEDYEYDQLGQRTKVSDSLGDIRTFTYDQAGRVIRESEADGTSFTFDYDAAGRTVSRGYPDGTTESFTYTAGGRVSIMIDRAGNRLSYSYDARGRVLSSTTDTGERTTVTYDGDDNMATLTDGNGNTTTFEYDGNGHLSVERYADGSSRSFSYDAEGNLVTQTERDSSVIHFEYDERGLMTKRDLPGTNDDVYSYGLSGQMLTAQNDNANIAFTYDAGGRLVREEINGSTVEYAYDPVNLTRTITYPGGRRVTQVYDERERLASIEDGQGASLMSFTYSARDLRISQQNANGTQIRYTYGSTRQLSEIQHTVGTTELVRLGYDYNANDRVLREENMTVTDSSQQFLYDSDDRVTTYRRGTLVGSDIPAPTREISYDLDVVGNWTTVTRDGTEEVRTLNELNQYTAIDSTPVSHSDTGDLLDDGEFSYEYDGAGRLLTVRSGGSVLASYEYGPLGRRLASSDDTGTRTEYFYDTRLNIIEEQSGGATVATYVHGVGQDDVLSMSRGGNDYTFHKNRTNSIVAVTDAGGSVVETYEYDPYGSVTVLDGSGSELSESAIGNPYRFSGRYYDENGRIYYYRARFYHPRLGRFLSQDPAGFVDGFNLYEYATGDPFNRADPMGLGSKSCKVGAKIEFDAASKIQKLTGRFIKAFGLRFKIGGGVAGEVRACTESCCIGDQPKTVSYMEYSLKADLKMAFGGPIPSLSVSVPLIGSVGLHGTLVFGVSGGGSITGKVTGNCKVQFSGMACVKASGGVVLFLGGQLAEAPGIDPFEGKIGIEGKGALSGEVCYSSMGFSFQACLSGSISVVAEFKAWFVTIGGSYDIVAGQVCS